MGTCRAQQRAVPSGGGREGGGNSFLSEVAIVMGCSYDFWYLAVKSGGVIIEAR